MNLDDIEKINILALQMNKVRERIVEYNNNLNIALDFNKTISDIEKSL